MIVSVAARPQQKDDCDNRKALFRRGASDRPIHIPAQQTRQPTRDPMVPRLNYRVAQENQVTVFYGL